MKSIFVAIAIVMINAFPATAKIRVGVKDAPPVLYTQDSSLSGFSIDIWEGAAKDLDLNTQYQVYSSIKELMDAIRANEIDVAIGAVSVTAEREAQGIDFSYPFYQSGLQIIQSKNNEAIHIKLGRHLGGWNAFQAVVLVLGSCLLFGTLIYWFERHNDSGFSGDEFGLKAIIQGIGNGFWFSVVTLGTFGYGDMTPKTVRGRAIAILWMGISFFILANYISAVTERRLNQPIEALSLSRKQTKIGVVKQTTADQYLDRYPVQEFQFVSIEEAFTALKQGEIDGVLTDAPIARYAVQNDSRLLTDSELVSSEMYAIAVKDGNDNLLEQLDQYLIGNSEMIKGLEEKWEIQEVN